MTDSATREAARGVLKDPDALTVLIEKSDGIAAAFESIQVGVLIAELKAMCEAHPVLRAEIESRGVIDRLEKFSALGARCGKDLRRTRTALESVQKGLSR